MSPRDGSQVVRTDDKLPHLLIHLSGPLSAFSFTLATPYPILAFHDALLRSPLLSIVLPVLPRSENDGIGTGVDAVCTHHLDPTGQGMDRKKVYWELSRLTYGVSRLGHYTLDQNSLYVDGEQWPLSLCFSEEPTFSLLPRYQYPPPFSVFSSFSLQVTHIKTWLPPPTVSILSFYKSLLCL